LIERIHRNTESHTINFEGKSIKASISLCLSTYSEHCDDSEKLIKACDDAMYAAKKMGVIRLS